MNEAMEPLVGLRQAVASTLARHGLALVQLAVAPGESADGPHEVQITAALPDGWDRTEVDDTFDQIIESARRAEISKKADAIKAQLEQDLRERLEGGGGILD